MNDFVIINGISYSVISSITEQEQENGLMFYPSINIGMCFPYLVPNIHKFWMKNTIVPLDIVFCRNNKIIDICYGEPLCEDNIGPDSETDLVIEFPYLFCKNNNINIGDSVNLNLSLKSLAKQFSL